MGMNGDKIDDALGAAAFIALRATVMTDVLIGKFRRYYRDTEVQREFYLDVLCLHLDFYHRLGAGLIDPAGDNNDLTSALVDDRIGTVTGACVAYIESQSEKPAFARDIDIDTFPEVFWKFHEWSVQFRDINEGDDNVLSNFISKWVKRLCIRERHFPKFVGSISAPMHFFMNDPRFLAILNIDKP